MKALTTFKFICILLCLSVLNTAGYSQKPGKAAVKVAPVESSLKPKAARQPSDRVRLERLNEYVEERTREFNLIAPDRKLELQELSQYVSEMKATNKPVRLTFVCTANSRRSQLAEIWAATAAVYYDIPHIETYSGGTGISAFNRRISRTLSSAGFDVITRPGFNSQVQVRYSDREPPIFCYSKSYNDASNPKEDYIAVMLCEDADAACPIMPGATYRVAIPYVDPRLSDHSEEETEAYHDANAQIAREMLYMMSLVH